MKRFNIKQTKKKIRNSRRIEQRKQGRENTQRNYKWGFFRFISSIKHNKAILRLEAQRQSSLKIALKYRKIKLTADPAAGKKNRKHYNNIFKTLRKNNSHVEPYVYLNDHPKLKLK